jgi:hypothetical protein
MMSDRVEAVSSALVIGGIGVTLVRVGEGWRFHAWHHGAGTDHTLEPPAAEDCARLFATVDDAVAYFRAQYGDTLRERLFGS